MLEFYLSSYYLGIGGGPQHHISPLHIQHLFTLAVALLACKTLSIETLYIVVFHIVGCYWYVHWYIVRV